MLKKNDVFYKLKITCLADGTKEPNIYQLYATLFLIYIIKLYRILFTFNEIKAYRSDLKLWETKITKYSFTYYKYELFGKKTKLRLFKLKNKDAKYIWTTIKIDEIKWTNKERKWFENK